tara:strand:- start:268 stop:480 length:213 start_codon:yes stop_codon:yes gene_type:complete
MSKIRDQLNDLKASIENARKQMDVITTENTLLKKQQDNIVSEKAELIRKNELAKSEIESIIERIKNIDVN